MLLRPQKYDIDLIFSPGNSIPVPDALSRAYLPNTEKDDKSLEYQIHLLVSNLPISEHKLREIQNATENDQVLQKLKQLILDGFPDSKSSTPAELIPYFQVRSELSIAEGLIFKGYKIVIPYSLWKEMNERIHMGDLGIEHCKARAGQLMYWSNINADITNMVSNCSHVLRIVDIIKKSHLLHMKFQLHHGTRWVWTYFHSKAEIIYQLWTTSAIIQKYAY